MNYFEFIVTLNDEKQYTYGCEIAQDIETLDELKQMAIDDFEEEDEEAASLIDKSNVSVEVNANGELYSYLAECFTESTADDIINILYQLTTDFYDEYQVIAYLECFGLTNFELQDVTDKTFGGQYFSSNADAAEYYLNNYRDDIPEDIKNVIDYDYAYTYLGINDDLFESRGYYFWA
jgi:hypothetical protein